MTRRRRNGEEVALFRYRIIAPLFRPKLSRGDRTRLVQALSEETWIDPEGRSRKIPPGTIRDWLRRYRTAGFDGLHPKSRSDRGRSRSITPGQANALVAMRKALPDLTVIQLQERMILEGHLATGDVSVQTLYRFFRKRGLTRRDLAAENPIRDLRPFRFASRNDCWQVDVLHGPRVRGQAGRKAKSYLIAFIDDATRLVPAAVFHGTENTETLADVFLRALRKRGIPTMLYADNGRVFRSKALALACARLGIEQVHSRPYTPEGRGKIERFFRTVRQDFLLSLPASKQLPTLSELNDSFQSWLENIYQVRKHRGLASMSPIDAWVHDETPIRNLPPLTDLNRLFFSAVTRRVRQDCTVYLRNKRYETGPEFRGKKVTLRYAMSTPDEVYLDDGGQTMRKLRLVDCVANRRIRRRKVDSK